MNRKEQLSKWDAISLLAQVVQLLFFAVWVMLVLGLTDAPLWAWVIAILYVLWQVLCFIIYGTRNFIANQVREEIMEGDGDE